MKNFNQQQRGDDRFLPRYRTYRELKASNFGKRARCSNPTVGGIEDLVTQPKYDSVSFAAGAAFAAQTLFQTIKGQSGKTLAQTNMTLAGALPNPQRLNLRALRVWIANSTVPVDLFNLLQNVSIEVKFNGKSYFEGPLGLLTAGCGAMVTAAAQVGTAPAGSAPLFATSNGQPDQRNVFSLNQPIMIEQGEPIEVKLNADIAFNFAAAGANPAGVGTTIYVILDGDLYRAVS